MANKLFAKAQAIPLQFYNNVYDGADDITNKIN